MWICSQSTPAFFRLISGMHFRWMPKCGAVTSRIRLPESCASAPPISDRLTSSLRSIHSRDVIGRAVEGVVAGTNLRVARLADVILLKLFAGGPQDAWDVHQALAVGGPNVRDEVEQHVGALPRDAQELWETIKTR